MLCIYTAVRSPSVFNWTIVAWLFLTVVFANLAEAVAEGRGKAQAETLRRAKRDTMARRVTNWKPGADPASLREESVPGTALTLGDKVVVEAGQVIPGDGDVVEGIASVDESAITGESAPVIRESGGRRHRACARDHGAAAAHVMAAGWRRHCRSRRCGSDCGVVAETEGKARGSAAGRGGRSTGARDFAGSFAASRATRCAKTRRAADASGCATRREFRATAAVAPEHQARRDDEQCRLQGLDLPCWRNCRSAGVPGGLPRRHPLRGLDLHPPGSGRRTRALLAQGGDFGAASGFSAAFPRSSACRRRNCANRRRFPPA